MFLRFFLDIFLTIECSVGYDVQDPNQTNIMSAYDIEILKPWVANICKIPTLDLNNAFESAVGEWCSIQWRHRNIFMLVLFTILSFVGIKPLNLDFLGDTSSKAPPTQKKNIKN